MPPYPGRLFHHPDYSLLLKYFPESDYQWPKNPDYQKILEGRANEAPEWIISVEMNSDKRKAFWQALRHPYGSCLKEGTSVVGLKEGTSVVGMVREMTPAGYNVDLYFEGVTLAGFMQNTLAGINKLHNPKSILGKTFDLMIESFSQEEGTYIVSRRKYLQSLIPTALSAIVAKHRLRREYLQSLIPTAIKQLDEKRNLKPIEFDGTYRWIFSDETTGTKNDLNLERYLSTEKDFSAELFAIHSFLNYQVKIRINPLRRFPVLSLAQIEKWHKKPDFTTHREELNSMVEIKLQIFVDWAKKGFKNNNIQNFQASDVDWVKKTFNPQPFLTNENQIRKNLCRGIERFLEQEKVCINTEGNQILGAFLVFSSGLSFRNRNRDIWQKFDQDLKDNFRQCTKHK